ncbi:MAG: YggT family protein [Gammaproteobacteria bacterium]|nr:YggT family protein [Gammaproteobacteria bacterium]MCY4322070.1 YggT family protein [Gammaproteobacteria bacterium]
MDNSMFGGLSIIAGLALDLAALLAAVRFLLQAAGVDGYNTVAQHVIKATDPVLAPLRIVLPSQGRIDLASIVGVWLLQTAKVALFHEPAIVVLLLGGLVQSLALFANLFFFALIAVVVLSFVAPVSSHPGAVILRQVTEPLLSPVRRIIQPVGGLDFSVLVVLFALMIVRGNLLPWLGALVGL